MQYIFYFPWCQCFLLCYISENRPVLKKRKTFSTNESLTLTSYTEDQRQLMLITAGKACFQKICQVPQVVISPLHYMLSNKKIRNRLLLQKRFAVSETHLVQSHLLIILLSSSLPFIHPFGIVFVISLQSEL